MLSEGGLQSALVFPELFQRKLSDRTRHDDAAEQDLVVKLYLDNFRRRLVDCKASNSLIDALTSDTRKFNQFWDVIVFEDCEDIDQLLKEV